LRSFSTVRIKRFLKWPCRTGRVSRIEEWLSTRYITVVLNPDQKLAPFPVYARRQLQHAAAAFALVIIALGIGVFGYHWIGQESWIDALLNASMILSGEGPVDRLPTNASKIFASLYALFGGVVFIVTMGLILTPLVHRLLHRLHIEEDRRRKTEAAKAPMSPQ
jgi:hypothetical protein